ncbi:PRMT5 arginine-N-methyltransferase-domain-containing protein, partial [Jimgerdemannia flammicorona]
MNEGHLEFEGTDSRDIVSSLSTSPPPSHLIRTLNSPTGRLPSATRSRPRRLGGNNVSPHNQSILSKRPFLYCPTLIHPRALRFQRHHGCRRRPRSTRQLQSARRGVGRAQGPRVRRREEPERVGYVSWGFSSAFPRDCLFLFIYEEFGAMDGDQYCYDDVCRLQNMKAEQWGDQVTVVFTDMRRWKAPEKCDILVSELLGSFGDNELSPECLDGAQKFLKPGGISIPASYTAYVTPLSSSKLHSEVAAYKDLAHFETPYVVMFQSVAELADPQPLWRFDHPNCREVPDDPDEASMVLSSNLHNVRHTHVTFDSAHAMTVHGVAGYFESVLYDDVIISIHPNTHSPGMFSWFPIFFPLRAPLAVPKGAIVEVDFWRLTDGKKVWYEWCVQTRLEVSEGPEGGKRVVRLTTSPIHNVSGRSSWIG